MDKRNLIALLDNWTVLNQFIMQLSEKEAAFLFEYEKANRYRSTFVLRLHSRLNKLRRERERQVFVERITRGQEATTKVKQIPNDID